MCSLIWRPFRALARSRRPIPASRHAIWRRTWSLRTNIRNSKCATSETSRRRRTTSRPGCRQQWRLSRRRIQRSRRATRSWSGSRGRLAAAEFAPELHVRPTPALDHNGAFNPAKLPDFFGGDQMRRCFAVARRRFAAKQLELGNLSFATLDHVAVFGGHGSSTSISRTPPAKVAKMLADELDAAKNGSNIEYVLLDACHQGDRNSFFLENQCPGCPEALDGSEPLGEKAQLR